MKKIAEFFRKKQVIITLVVILCIGIASGAFALFIYPWSNVARGISINGINIGAMDKATAVDAIRSDGDLGGQEISVTDETGNSKRFYGSDISLCYDYEKTVEEAYKIGRSGVFFDDLSSLIKNVFVPYDMGYKYGFDAEKLGGILYDFGVFVNGEMKEYTLEYEKGYVKVSKGVAGQKKDVSQAAAVASDAISGGNFDIAVKLEKENPPEPSEKTLIDYIYKAPLEATYTIEDGVVKITDEVPGIGVSQEEVKEKIALLSAGDVITLKIIDIMPEVTRKSLYNELFNHTLGSFTSKYSTSNKSRTANVVLASKLINGMVLAPGEVFSYNKAVGPRTSARGFKEATVYSNGESVMGIGGGICQVSSTLYSAVLYADLEVVERQNHSMTVDYMPKGQDATVSYGTIDFKFRNNTNNPVKIVATPSGGVLTVSILGTKSETEKTVKITNSIVDVINKTTETVKDDTLAQGETKTLSVGKTGYVVDTYKKVYENGKEVKSEYVSRSRYKMVPQKTAVGTIPTATAEPEINSQEKAPDTGTTEAPDENVGDAPVFNEEEIVGTPTPKEEDVSAKRPDANEKEDSVKEPEQKEETEADR